MNKKLNEMTNQELEEAIKQMKAEQEARAKAEEEKRRAEEEAKRKEEEAKRVAEAEKEASELVEKQKAVLGKCYKHTVTRKYPASQYVTYYKVVGVYENLAIVSAVKRHENYISRSTDYVPLNAFEGYEVISRAEFEKEYNNSLDGFSSLIRDFIEHPSILF